jgi:MarR family transcriptional regulator, organic hydroperoxide resistance regulator
MAMTANASAMQSKTRNDNRLDDRISLIVHRLNSRFTQIANQLLQTRDINMYDSRILLFLLERKEMRVGELVEAMALPQSTISHQLTRLKSRKLIRRRRTRGDNRAVAITLTPAGEEVARASEIFSLEVQSRIAEEFSSEEMRQLRRVLNHMYTVLSTSHIVPDEALKPAKPVSRLRLARRRN